MMNITIVYVGNAKDNYIIEGCKEFAKRIGAYAKLNQIELKDYKTVDESLPQRKLAMENEAKKIIESIPDKSYKIALCVEGKEIDSVEFSHKFEDIMNKGYSHITFIIGGPFGMTDEVKNMCDFKLSISKMTFSHRMIRMILLEQIYRALNISSGGNYHK